MVKILARRFGPLTTALALSLVGLTGCSWFEGGRQVAAPSPAAAPSPVATDQAAIDARMVSIQAELDRMRAEQQQRIEQQQQQIQLQQQQIEQQQQILQQQQRIQHDIARVPPAQSPVQSPAQMGQAGQTGGAALGPMAQQTDPNAQAPAPAQAHGGFTATFPAFQFWDPSDPKPKVNRTGPDQAGRGGD